MKPFVELDFVILGVQKNYIGQYTINQQYLVNLLL